jgi:hypothetical protein
MSPKHPRAAAIADARETLDRMKLNAVALSAFAFAGITLVVAAGPQTVTANASTPAAPTTAVPDSNAGSYDDNGAAVAPSNQGGYPDQQQARPPIISAQS